MELGVVFIVSLFCVIGPFSPPELHSPGEDVEADDPGYDTHREDGKEMGKVVEKIGKTGGF